MKTTLIPLKQLTDGAEKISFMTKRKMNGVTLNVMQSIIRDGLLYPLIVTKKDGKFFVVDGKKRLMAMRKIAKSKTIAKRIFEVPCIIQTSAPRSSVQHRRPTLLTAPELAHRIIVAAKESVSYVSIAQRFECDVSVVKDCLSLPGLHPELLMHFTKEVITFEQAVAFATIKNKTAQLALLHQLGPFVSNEDIISAIRSGATVVELSEDNIIFLPSRVRPEEVEEQRTFEFGEVSLEPIKYDVPIVA